MMKDENKGSIITIGSIASGTPPAYFNGIHYSVSKGALSALTRSGAKELGARGIRVNSLVLGPVVSEGVVPREVRDAASQSFLGRPLTAHEVAYACLFLASPLASGISGESIVLGGY